MTHAIEFSHRAAKQFSDLPETVQERLAPRIDALAEDPRPRGSTKLEGLKNSYRIRVGDYRIVYSIYDEHEVVLVARIAHRRDVYRGL